MNRCPSSRCGSSEGPNLYFPRATIKLTLDISGLAAASEESAKRFATRIGLKNARPGAPDSGFRQRFALRAVGRLVRAIATEAGTARLGVRVRPTSDQHQIVVAYPWRRRERAQVMGVAVAEVLDAVAARRRRGDGRGWPHWCATPSPAPSRTRSRPRIPVVAVTGTNGKTTTSRMIAHIARVDGRLVGWSSTDGIYVDGELVEAGDYSGPSGAGRVLAHEDVQLAVTETARGGILLKGIGLTRNDVSVVTNVTADHLGLHGIDTVDQLAEVKARGPADHPQGRLGGAQRRRPAGPRDARPRSWRSPGCSPATRLAGDPRGPRRRRPGDHRHRRLDLGPHPAPTPTRWSSWSTSR